jgi:thymidylate synthase ThyX
LEYDAIPVAILIIYNRTSVHAEEEIRVIMSDVAQQLKDKFPTLYGDMSLNNVGEWVFAHSKV